MPSILFNNDNDSNKEKIETAITPSQMQTENNKSDTSQIVQKEEDFAIFPQWDVIPPNAIINPRLKKNK